MYSIVVKKVFLFKTLLLTSMLWGVSMGLLINNQVYATKIYNIGSTSTILSIKSQKGLGYARFAKGNCTDYAASRRPDIFPSKAGKDRLFGGNAIQWYKNARTSGLETGKIPAVGAIAVYGKGRGASSSYGHVAIVEHIRDDGTIEVMDMNYLSENVVTRRIVKNDLAIGYIYVMDGYKIHTDGYTGKKAVKPQTMFSMNLVQTGTYKKVGKDKSYLINNNTQLEIPVHTGGENASDVDVTPHQYHSDTVSVVSDSSQLSYVETPNSSIFKIENLDDSYDAMAMNNAVYIGSMMELSG